MSLHNQLKNCLSKKIEKIITLCIFWRKRVSKCSNTFDQLLIYWNIRLVGIIYKYTKFYKYSCFDFMAHSIFTFDEFWERLSTSIFRKSSSAVINTRPRLPSRPSFRFLWLKIKVICIMNSLLICNLPTLAYLK